MKEFQTNVRVLYISMPYSYGWDPVESIMLVVSASCCLCYMQESKGRGPQFKCAINSLYYLDRFSLGEYINSKSPFTVLSFMHVGIAHESRRFNCEFKERAWLCVARPRDSWTTNCHEN